MQWTAADLDDFVRRSDELGGPNSAGCNQLWQDFEYVLGVKVDVSLDPFGEAYVAQQVRVYEELAGKAYDMSRDEMTSFDMPRHVTAPNPYNHPDPAGLAVHLQRLSRALRHAAPVLGETLLDMGCGWGLSSELAAYLGLTVRAVDINPDFVSLVRQRAERSKLAITIEQSTFDTYTPPEPADLAMYYECLHHAIRPWVTIERTHDNLKEGGRIVLAGEPINSIWWPNWGLRLDPISVYCIRKFGWFESGWALPFLLKALHRSGFVPRSYLSADPQIGYAVVGRKGDPHEVPAEVAAVLFQPVNALLDGRWLLMVDEGSLRLSLPRGKRRASLKITSFRGRSLQARFECGSTVFQGDVPVGASEIALEGIKEGDELRFKVEGWYPAQELQSADHRRLGLHLESISFHDD